MKEKKRENWRKKEGKLEKHNGETRKGKKCKQS